jgi:hypothetical protein
LKRLLFGLVGCVLVILLVCPFITESLCDADLSENTWTSIATLPIEDFTVGVATVEGKIYAMFFGIGTLTSEGVQNTNCIYNPQTNSWEIKESEKNFWGTKVGVNTAVCQNKIYCFGRGYVANKVYDPATNSWAPIPPDPQAREFVSSCTVNNKIYVFGGGIIVGVFEGESVNTTEVFNPESSTWATLTPMPEAILHPLALAIDTKIYVFGGTNVLIYNTETDQWEITDAEGGSCFYDDGAITSGIHAPKRIYLFKGTTTRIFDQSTETYSNGTSIPQPIRNYDVEIIDDVMYVVGGGYTITNSNGAFISSVKVDFRYVPVGYSSLPLQSDLPVEPSSLFFTVAGVVIAATVIVGGASLLLYRTKRKPKKQIAQFV